MKQNNQYRAMKDSGIEWIGEIPKNWNVSAFKYVICQNDGGIWGEDPSGIDDKIVLRSTEQTVDGKWDIANPAGRNLSAIPNLDFYRCREGDLLITKSSGSSLHIGKTTIVNSDVAAMECYYSNFIQRIRVRRGECAKYYWYILNSDLARAQFEYVQNTTSGIGNINAAYIAQLIIPRLHFEEQYRIVAYLDSQCAHLDSVLSQTHSSIEEYKKLKQAVITQAVTKGVRGDRPMKDSGIEWLARIPEDWSVERGKAIFYETNERSITGTEELLTVSHITGVTPRSMKNVNMFMSESLIDYKICHVGDLAANTMWMWQGAIGVSKYEGVISPSYNTYRQRNKIYHPDYLEYLLRIPPLVATYSAYSTGITASRLRLYPDQFFSILFPIPPVDEQQEIAEYLNRKIPEMNQLIVKKEAFLVELENYKKSMIYEYVTGKKEVI